MGLSRAFRAIDAWPIGSLYSNGGLSTNPSTLLGGGTWVAHGEGRVVVSLDAGAVEFDVLGETGGEKTHTLTTSEMPAHTHPIDEVANVIAAAPGNTSVQGTNEAPSTVVPPGAGGSTGGGAAHNNLQPYIVAYIWRRTA